jgi:hypothetical protein
MVGRVLVLGMRTAGNETVEQVFDAMSQFHCQHSVGDSIADQRQHFVDVPGVVGEQGLINRTLPLAGLRIGGAGGLVTGCCEIPPQFLTIGEQVICPSDVPSDAVPARIGAAGGKCARPVDVGCQIPPRPRNQPGAVLMTHSGWRRRR